MESKIKENAKKYFEEELSGEPLCQDLIVNWLTEFAEQQIKLFTLSSDKKECMKMSFNYENVEIFEGDIIKETTMYHSGDITNFMSVEKIGKVIFKLESNWYLETIDGNKPLNITNPNPIYWKRKLEKI